MCPVLSPAADLHSLRQIKHVDHPLLQTLIFYIVERVDLNGPGKNSLKTGPDGRNRKGNDRKARLVSRDIAVDDLHGSVPVFQIQLLLPFRKSKGLFFIHWLKARLTESFNHRRTGVGCRLFPICLVGCLQYRKLPVAERFVEINGAVIAVIVIILPVRRSRRIAVSSCRTLIHTVYRSPGQYDGKSSGFQIPHSFADHPLHAQRITDHGRLFYGKVTPHHLKAADVPLCKRICHTLYCLFRKPV